MAFVWAMNFDFNFDMNFNIYYRLLRQKAETVLKNRPAYIHMQI